MADRTLSLLDVCDEVNVVKHYVGCVYLACQHIQGGERADLCAVADAAREKLMAIEAALQRLVEGDPPASP